MNLFCATNCEKYRFFLHIRKPRVWNIAKHRDSPVWCCCCCWSWKILFFPFLSEIFAFLLHKRALYKLLLCSLCGREFPNLEQKFDWYMYLPIYHPNKWLKIKRDLVYCNRLLAVLFNEQKKASPHVYQWSADCNEPVYVTGSQLPGQTGMRWFASLRVLYESCNSYSLFIWNSKREKKLAHIVQKLQSM